VQWLSGPDDNCAAAGQVIAADLPHTLKGDHLRLKQVLINLVKNTLKFVSGGEISIRAAYNPHE